MSSTRRQQKAETRAALLEAARALFGERGFADTQIGDIAGRAGVAHGTFYVHFADKGQVLDELLAAYNDALGRRLAARLGVQGFVAVIAGDERFTATVGVLAAGSGEPEVFTISTADQASQTRALDRLSGPLPAILRPSLGIGLVDVADVKGAVVVRSTAGAADAGPSTGDVIVGAAGKPVTLCGELASTPIGALALVALGYRSLSLTPSALGPVKALLLELDAKKAGDLMGALLEKPAGISIRKRLEEFAAAEGLQL